MSDESTPEKNKAPEADTESAPTAGSGELQHVATIRDWRQRYAGPDGEYVYRRMINVGPKGSKVRRVKGGERVNAERDGITPRRLKALWFSGMIELANSAAAPRLPLKKNIIDNRAIRLEEERVAKAVVDKAEAERLARRELNALRIEEEKQRELALSAIASAEARERQELEDMIAAEERAARDATIDKMMADRRKDQSEEAAKAKNASEEKAQLEVEKANVARERREAAEAKASKRNAGLERATLDRIAKREAEEAKRHAPPAEPSSEKLDNTKNVISADEAKAALKD